MSELGTYRGQPVTEEFLKQLVNACLNDDGQELHNPVPVVEVIEGIRPLTLQDQIKRILQIEINRKARREGLETLEESMDFDVEEEDPAPMSGYEFEDMKDETIFDVQGEDIKNDTKSNNDVSKDGLSDSTEGSVGESDIEPQ